MKIVINENKKVLELTKNDGTIIDQSSYRTLLDDDYTMEDLIEDNEKFNRTLSSFKEFDDVKELGVVLKLHNWDE